MKLKSFFAAVCCFVPMMCMAQYYNPYAGHDFANCSGKVTCGACYGTGNCYGYVCGACRGTGLMNCPACIGYKQGKLMAEQAMARREKELKENPIQMWGAIVPEMASGNYEKAYEYYEYLAENHNDGQAYLYLGYMNELGMGTSKSYSYARYCYEKGAELGNQYCKAEFHRISQGRYLQKECEQIIRKHYQNINMMGISAANSMNWGLSSGTISGSSPSQRKSDYGYVNCQHCHGTGVCSVCNGKGWEYSTYTSGTMRCSSCQGDKRCKFCVGRGTRYQRIR